MNHGADQTRLDDLNAELAEFERRYGMTSDEFYRLYKAGRTDDRMDFVEWASLAQIAENLRRKSIG
ncbi:MAG TPA: hypothetical protein VL334_17105 [Anaerolineae bacterium]|nr:hypothetical protein [Anaerolineae bacterium]